MNYSDPTKAPKAHPQAPEAELPQAPPGAPEGHDASPAQSDRPQPDPEVAEITFTSDDVQVEYRFEATHPAYAYSCHPEGSPTFIAESRGRSRDEILAELTAAPADPANLVCLPGREAR